MGNADVLIDYSFHKELLARLSVGQITADDIPQLLGQPKHIFEGDRFLVPGKCKVLYYSATSRGESDIYLYLDKQGRLAHVDLWHTGKWSILLYYVAILSSIVITATWLLLPATIRRQEQRQALAWWLVTALIGLWYVGSGLLLSAGTNWRLGTVVIPLNLIGWVVAATRTLATLTSVGWKGMLHME